MGPKFIDVLITAIICILVIAAILLFFFESNAELITLTWDAPTEPHDGVRIFQKTAREGDIYNFSSPVADIPFPGTTANVEVEGEPDAVLKYQWVARAYRDDLESSDSNEVSYKVVNIPPIVPVDLSAAQQGTVISLSWEQPSDPHPIDHWKVYAKTDGDFVEIGTVDDENNLTLTADLNDLAPADQVTELTFAVVAFRRSGVFSANSTEAIVTIDRRALPPVQNLRIEIEIPI